MPSTSNNSRRNNKKNYNTDPVTLTGSFFLSNWFFAYVYRIGYLAYTLPAKSLRFKLRPQESSTFNAEKATNAWKLELEQNPSSPSVFNALWKCYGLEYSLIGIYKFVWGVFTWLGAYYFLKMTIIFVQNKQPLLNGHMYALALFLSALFSSISIHQLYAECNRMGIQVRSAISSLVYRKALRLSRVRGGAGEVINIISTDLARVTDCIVNFHFLWSAFLECLAILAISIYEVGLSALPAVGFVLILLPVQMYLGKFTAETSRKHSATTTERVHIMSEILTAIKLIKFYAWEQPFSEKIEEIRKTELEAIYKQMMIKTVNYTVVFAVPVLIATCSLATYVYTGNKLTASVSFTVLSVFNTLRYPFFMLPLAVRGLAGANTAMAHLNSFLLSEEVDVLLISKNEDNDETSFEIKDSDFKWDGADSQKPTLSNISIKVKKGDKVAIIGDVGSGKSSLIAALLGQIRQTRGERLKIYGSTSYVPQEAWLLNTTLRENIIFGHPYDKKKYKEVVRVCSLQRDLTLLAAGDMTEIAERGSNMSGGQRQRSSLARAVYHDCDIVLLDDPLSAVDQHVGNHIFNECFCKHLKNKTVIMAIHQLQYLEKMDWIIMMKNGLIEKQGTYQDMLEYAEFKRLIDAHVAGGERDDVDDEAEIMNDENFEIPDAPTAAVDIVIESPSKKHGRYPDIGQLTISDRNQLSILKHSDLNEKTISSMIERNQLSIIKGTDVRKAIEQNELSVYSIPDIDQENDADEIARERGKLVKEDKSTDSSTLVDFAAYLRAPWGTFLSSSVMVFFTLVHLVRMASDYWLRLWVPRVGGFSDAVYLGVYAGAVGVFSAGALLRGYLFSRMSIRKSNFFHAALFRSIMRAPMSFFDSTPLGRILSTFSKHMLTIDESLSDALFQALQYLPLGLGALILSAVIVPLNYIPVIVLSLIAILIVKLSARAEEKTKSLDALTKPIIFAHLTASLEGLFSIRAYHAEKRFDKLMLEKLDSNHESLFAMLLVKSWIALNLDIVSSFVVYFTALLVVIFRNESADMASVAGLALSNVLQMLVFVQWTVRMIGDAMAQMSSVGQVAYYGNNVSSEAPPHIPDTMPRQTWPENGLIKFENIGLRYSEHGVKVLKGINFTIYPTEKIGIVGRTGSGKSTLLISLLRIVEACEGRMLIDGVDISQIGLEDLRSKIAIIPQEPVLFKGTVRSNLDPFNKSTDDQIWHALDAAHLGTKIRDMTDKLESKVIENGKNFSLGQRQLFCIARAILSRTKILVLDEATANVSPETDMLIQETIRTNFKDMTVLTIAHRINTIIDSDRILLLDAGEVIEFDDPVSLLNMKGGSFKDLVDQTGPASARKLYEMATEASKNRVSKVPALVNKELVSTPQTPTVGTGKTTIQELAAQKKDNI